MESVDFRPYFGEKPVREWFNPCAPRIMSGEIDPDAMTPQEALVIMIMDPALIRHPLMRVNGRAEAGFDREAVDDWIGLKPKAPAGLDVAPIQTGSAQVDS